MKHILTLMAAFCVALMFTACSSNTPSDIAGKSIEYLKEQKFDKYVDLIYVSDAQKANVEKLQNEKEAYAELLEEKYTKSMEKNGGITGYSIVSEEIADDGESAIVMMDVTYGNGDTRTQNVKLRKDSDDNWKIDMGK